MRGYNIGVSLACLLMRVPPKVGGRSPRDSFGGKGMNALVLGSFED